MSQTKAEDILERFPFLTDYGRELEVPEGFVIIKDGDAAGSMFFIRDGLVEVTKDERLLAVLEPGEVFGEMSLVDGRPRSANVAALQPSALLRIDRSAFESAGAKNLDLLRFMMEVMSTRIRNTNALAAAFAPAREGPPAALAAEDSEPAGDGLVAADAMIYSAAGAVRPKTPAAKAEKPRRPEDDDPAGPKGGPDDRKTERRW